MEILNIVALFVIVTRVVERVPTETVATGVTCPADTFLGYPRASRLPVGSRHPDLSEGPTLDLPKERPRNRDRSGDRGNRSSYDKEVWSSIFSPGS